MECSVSYDQENDCLIAHCQGIMDKEGQKKHAQEILKMATKHDCRCLLNDLRNATFEFSTIEIYELPRILEIEGIDHSWRRAVLVKEEQIKEVHFFETVAVNRGYRVKIFAELNEAMEWLKE